MAYSVAHWLAWLAVLMQALFGALEIFVPRTVFDAVFPTYYDTSNAPTWVETEKLTRNMGLYNWFLAFGLLLSLTGWLGFPPTSQFFLLCVGVAGAFGLFSVGHSMAFWAQMVLGLVPCLLLFHGL